MPDFLLEIGCEEIPARMIDAASAELRERVQKLLERAVIELPATEKLVFLLHDVEGYNHAKIGRLLGLTEDESKLGLHQARLRIRELVAEQS